MMPKKMLLGSPVDANADDKRIRRCEYDKINYAVTQKKKKSVCEKKL
jgi:hypothetical protein